MSGKKKILVLGATGHFGKRISQRLVGEANTELVVTSRSKHKADQLAARLSQLDRHYPVSACAIDQQQDEFERDLSRLSPDIVVHTAGPYQGQSYRVGKACISIGCHYIDLADGRQFVENFDQLNASAIRANVLAVSGASTLPGLSSAVVDRFRSEFGQIESVKISIAPAHQTPRGAGTISAVLSYCGQSFSVLENGTLTKKFGWQDLTWQSYPKLGKRLSAACDVPDLSLLPNYIPGVRTVYFHASLEAKWEHMGLWCMGWLSRAGLVSNWSKAVPLFNWMSELLIGFGSDRGGMCITISGIDKEGHSKSLAWYLNAENNHGPEIPCTPSIILVRKLVRDEIAVRGALPCLGLITLDEFDREIDAFDINWEVVK